MGQLIDPKLLFEKIGLAPGMHIADFGSGRTGNFVFPSAAIIGNTGAVYAIDIIKESLKGIAKRANLDGLLNIHTIWADLEQPKGASIPAKSLDAVFLINFLSAVKARETVLNEAARITKARGLILIVDWKKTSLPFAPPNKELLDFDMLQRWGEPNGFRISEEFNVGEHHRGIILKRTAVCSL